MLSFFALLPIVALFALIATGRRSALFSGAIALLLLLCVSVYVWHLPLLQIASAGVKGGLIAIEIALIVLGILLIFEMLKKTGLFADLQRVVHLLSPDMRVQALFIAFALVHFIEGIAGFGTPALVVVPLLMLLGMSPPVAVSLALIGDTTPVIFGAIGLPVTYGIASSIPEGSAVAIESVTAAIAAFNIFGNLVLVTLITSIIVISHKATFRQAIEFLPFAGVISLLVSSVSLATALIIGPELPSVTGGIAGLLCIYYFAKKGVLLPSRIPDELRVKADSTQTASVVDRSLVMSVMPYALLVLLLVITRLPFKDFFQNALVVHFDTLFGYAVQYTFLPLYSGSTIILFSFFASMVFMRVRAHDAKQIFLSALHKIARPFATLLLLLFFVQIFIATGDNPHAYPSMPQVLATGAGSIFGGIWPLAAPFVGALGAFVAGSATVSNLLFSSFQYDVALVTGLSGVFVLALQGLGAAGGNAIALHNIVAALAVTGSREKESEVLRRNLLPFFIYTGAIGIFGLVLAQFL